MKTLLIEWIKTLLPEEEAAKVSLQNIQHLMPREQHYFADNRIYLNSYSPKWIKNGIKRILKQYPDTEIEMITMEKILWTMKQKSRYQKIPPYKAL
tara:strand:- start:100 stop:387 length:288 start_codon:yes stop_codon:yes gene_type:complete